MGYIWGKSNFEKTYPKEFFGVFMMIWVWKSGFNSWNQNFRKCTHFVWSTVYSVHLDIKLQGFLQSFTRFSTEVQGFLWRLDTLVWPIRSQHLLQLGS